MFLFPGAAAGHLAPEEGGMRERLLRRRVLLAVGCTLAWPGAWAQSTQDRSRDRIAREVRHELITLPYYGVFDNMAFRVEGDTVTLLGQVTRPTLKSDAERAVKQIEGVRRVDNQIEVLPLSPVDDRIRLNVYVATYGQPDLNQYALRAVPPIHIIVKNGNVTLEGAVAIEMDKTLFFTQTSGVPGVVSVTNRLQVAP
jgi:hyperosmotically inducible protein